MGRRVTVPLQLAPGVVKGQGKLEAVGRYVDADINAHYMSRRTSQHGYGLTLEGMVAYAELYVEKADAADWRVSPIRCADLTGVACPSGYCHLGGKAIKSKDAFGAGLVDAAAAVAGGASAPVSAG